jgi:uncharacterized phage protein (TIGR01671 family)
MGAEDGHPHMLYNLDFMTLTDLAKPSVFWSIMQFTGKKDQTGKDLYEGDICEGKWPYAKRCVVVWDDARCGFYFQPVNGVFKTAAYDKYYKLNANKFTIIGNVHENHELVTERRPHEL